MMKRTLRIALTPFTMERTKVQEKAYRVIDMIATGKRITELRIEHGYSVSDLQKYFGFEAPQAIYKWQKGQTLPSTDNLYALSDLLGVSMENILVPFNKVG